MVRSRHGDRCRHTCARTARRGSAPHQRARHCGTDRKGAGITHVVTIGLLANTCIESTSRFAMELGYHVTLVRDATAAVQPAMMHAAHELNGPAFAHAIVTTADVVTAFKAAARP
ncbi:isochorismatase family protein [Streptomyces tubercidicus]